MKFGKVLTVAALFFASHVYAETIDLGVAKNYNVFVFNSYQTTGWSSIGGSVAVGGNANISSSNIGTSSKNSYGLVVGGDLAKSYGNISGKAWVGGKVNAPTYDTYDSKNYSHTTAPIDFAATQKSLVSLSKSLAADTATGSVEYKYGSNGYLTGTGSNVEYFTLSGSALSSITNWTFNNILTDATLILNISGTNISLTGGWSGFSSYNTLLNLYDATTVNLSGINLSASVLAVGATITGGNGTVTGTVIANNWNNSLTLATGNSFDAVTVTSPVPEPHTYVLLLIGFGMMLFFSRYRKPHKSKLVNI
ncbi:MAG: choice-of-anchor A family protein [Methylophilaceae bacterium]